MARQGLMDDSGYDFFDAGDCANYESCREEAFNDGYQQGKTDTLGEIATRLEEELTMVMPRDKVKYLMYKVHTVFDEMKEQNNDNK